MDGDKQSMSLGMFFIVYLTVDIIGAIIESYDRLFMWRSRINVLVLFSIHGTIAWTAPGFWGWLVIVNMILMAWIYIEDRDIALELIAIDKENIT
jgi:hypothetical protein